MKTTISTLILIIALSSGMVAQDIDVYSKAKNDNYQLPPMNAKMTFDEFQLLNKRLKMQDMLYAMVVPGYVHFKAKDPITAYSLVGLRMLGFGGIVYVSNKTGILIPSLLEFSGISGNIYKTERNILFSSSALVLATYLFDWIHGKYRLEKKQEMIRYRYGLKVNLASIPIQHSDEVFLGFTVQYKF